MFQVLLADADGVYDPIDHNDRMLLGLRGMMSEAELHVLRSRLHQGKLNKARRGELFSFVPIGYVRTPEGGIALEPDEQARSSVRIVFEKVAELGSARRRMPTSSPTTSAWGCGCTTDRIRGPDLASAAAQYHLRHAPPPVLRRGVRVRAAPGRSDQAGRGQGRAAFRPGGGVAVPIARPGPRLH